MWKTMAPLLSGTCLFLAVAALTRSAAPAAETIEKGKPADARQAAPATKPSAARLKDMKAALADIEKGQLKQKEFALPDPAWFGEYLQLLKKECGVGWVTVDKASDEPRNPRAEIDGYNDVMRVEIEHRYGKGILEKLHEQAKAEYFKGKAKK